MYLFSKNSREEKTNKMPCQGYARLSVSFMFFFLICQFLWNVGSASPHPNVSMTQKLCLLLRSEGEHEKRHGKLIDFYLSISPPAVFDGPRNDTGTADISRRDKDISNGDLIWKWKQKYGDIWLCLRCWLLNSILLCFTRIRCDACVGNDVEFEIRWVAACAHRPVGDK